MHFVFVLLNAAILEVARKLKHRKTESAGRDTYSSRMGIGKAAALLTTLAIAVYALFVYMLVRMRAPAAIFWSSAVPLALICAATLWYATRHHERSPAFVEASALVFYLSMHLLLLGTRV